MLGLGLTHRPAALVFQAMEPRITERDVALLLMSEESLLALGAVLGWQARAALENEDESSLPVDVLPA
jgi:hypothetical protein